MRLFCPDEDEGGKCERSAGGEDMAVNGAPLANSTDHNGNTRAENESERQMALIKAYEPPIDLHHRS